MFNSLKFQTKLFMYYSVVFILIVSSALFFFYIYISQITLRQSEENLNQLTTSTMSQIDNFLLDMDRTTLYVISNPVVKEVFSGIKKSEEAQNYFSVTTEDNRQISDTLASICLANLQTPFRTSLYNANGDYISTGIRDNSNAIAKRVYHEDYGKWYTQLISGPGKVILPTHDDFWSEDANIKMISVLRQIIIPSSYESFGIVETQKPYDSLEKLLKQNDSPGRGIYLLTESGDIVYPVSADFTSSDAVYYLDRINTGKSGNADVTGPVTNKSELIYYTRSDYSGWTLILAEPKENLLKPIRLTGMIIVLTGTGLLFISLIFIFILSNKLTRPLKILRNSVRQVTLDNLSMDIAQSDDSDEIIELNHLFDGMFARLKDSMNELVQTRAHEMKAHMIALQSQMDPHFLYNMLSVINADSQTTGSEKTTQICVLLSSMLRYSTSYNDDFLPVGDEIRHVTNYLKLMKIRFEYKLDYEVAVDDKLYQKKTDIPKLTLQPIVENCFHHGFRSIQPPWHIKINAFCGGSTWYVEVSDNGAGFSEDKIKRIFEQVDEFVKNPYTSIKDLKLGGMGLINTIVRLRLLYKEDMIFKIEQNAGGGTKITLGGPIYD
ncbi:sensor histidine kinase YesM [Anaerobacterium chartisolvens]|uniref:Sensor histidine kinase YesM n=1 Tax=Anaerobacterium chartisolvens TaxID=1297424 RepID=A0A369BBR9_9FIRM|nr:histidine kinase [Anaerobacterium chartisolvens]RCX18795.1 sensor histidine kinase YesM [Anaerobacterium chartisolvens]